MKKDYAVAYAALVVLLLLVPGRNAQPTTLVVDTFQVKDSTSATYHGFLSSLHEHVNSTGVRWIRQHPVLRAQNLGVPPVYWLKIDLTGSSADSHVSFLIRSDNLYMLAFENNQGQQFAFKGDQDKVPASTPLTFGGSYRDIFGDGLSSRGLKNLPVNRRTALEHLDTLANFRGGADNHLKYPLAFFILTVCEAERFVDIEQAVLKLWDQEVSGTITQFGVKVSLVVNWAEASCALVAWDAHGHTQRVWNRNKEAKIISKQFGMKTAQVALSKVKPILQSTRCSNTFSN